MQSQHSSNSSNGSSSHSSASKRDYAAVAASTTSQSTEASNSARKTKSRADSFNEPLSSGTWCLWTHRTDSHKEPSSPQPAKGSYAAAAAANAGNSTGTSVSHQSASHCSDEEYDKRLSMRGEFNTLAGFWKQWQEIRAQHVGEECQWKYSVFRKGIRPVWEDAANANGGNWAVKLPRAALTSGKVSSLSPNLPPRRLTESECVELAHSLWTKTVIAMLRHQFDGANEIAGAAFSARPWGDVISMWNVDRDSVHVETVRQQLERLAPSRTASYRAHPNLSKRTSLVSESSQSLSPRSPRHSLLPTPSGNNSNNQTRGWAVTNKASSSSAASDRTSTTSTTTTLTLSPRITPLSPPLSPIITPHHISAVLTRGVLLETVDEHEHALIQQCAMAEFDDDRRTPENGDVSRLHLYGCDPNRANSSSPDTTPPPRSSSPCGTDSARLKSTATSVASLVI